MADICVKLSVALKQVKNLNLFSDTNKNGLKETRIF